MFDLVGPTLTKSQLDLLQVLEYLYDNPAQSSSNEVMLSPLSEEIGRDAVQRAVPELIERGYVKAFASLAGYSGAFLLPAGSHVVEEVRSHRENMSEQSVAVRDRILSWLHGVGPGAAPTLAKFYESPNALFYGAPFSPDIVSHGSRWLKEEGYLAGTGAWGGGILRPSITSKGTRVVEGGRSVNDPPNAPLAQSFSTVVNGGTNNVAIASSDFTQNSNLVSEAADGLVAMAALARETLELLASQGVDRAALEATLAEVEAINPATAEPGPVRAGLVKLQNVVAAGVGSAVGTMIVARITDLLEMVPG